MSNLGSQYIRMDPREGNFQARNFSMGNSNWTRMDGFDRRNGDCMTRIFEEMRNWLQYESFDFPSLPQHFHGNIKDVNSITYLLLLLSDFLKNARQSEEKYVMELLSEYVQREVSSFKLMWWIMATKNSQPIGEKEILGSKLSSLHEMYTASRTQLEIKVDYMLGMLKCWADAYSNGQAFGELVELHMLLCAVRQNFQVWVEEVVMTRAAQGCHEKRPVLSMQDILKKVNEIHRKVSIPSAPNPYCDWVRPRRKHKCSISCFLNTEFLFVSPEVPLAEEPRPAMCVRTHEGFKVVPKYLVDGQEELVGGRSSCELFPVGNHDGPESASESGSAVSRAGAVVFPDVIPTEVALSDLSSTSHSPRHSLSSSDDQGFASSSSRGRRVRQNLRFVSETSEWDPDRPFEVSPGVSDDGDQEVFFPTLSSQQQQRELPTSDSDWNNDSAIVSTSLFYQELMSTNAADVEPNQIGCFLSNLIRLANLSEKEK